MLKKTKHLTLLFGLALIAVPGGAATNLLTNPGFDSDLGGWDKFILATHEMEWSSMDESGAPNSGSLRISNLQPATTNEVSTCFPVTAGKTLVWGASSFAPDGLPLAGPGGRVRYFAQPNCAGSLGVAPETFLDRTRYGRSTWGWTQATTVIPPGAVSAELFLSAAANTPEIFMDNAYAYEGISCAEAPGFLCLAGSRFRVSAQWETVDGTLGFAGAVPLTSDSGFLWFFDPSNIEVVIKVLDACAFSDRFWVFAGGLTNVELTLNVTDTLSGERWSHSNPQEQAFLPRQDTAAFATCK